MKSSGASSAASHYALLASAPEANDGPLARGEGGCARGDGASAVSLSVAAPLNRRRSQSTGSRAPRSASVDSDLVAPISALSWGRPTQAMQVTQATQAMQASQASQAPPQLTPEHQALSDRLHDLPFFSAAADQSELEMAYIVQTALALAERKMALGEGFALATDMPSHLADGAPAALYDACAGAISSAARSPVRNAIGVSMSRSAELNLTLTQSVVGGGVGGVTAYIATELVLKAADRTAKRLNFIEVVPVDLNKALPYPGPVVLTIIDGAKTYRRRTAPELARAMQVVDEQRAHLAVVQAWLSGEGELPPYVQGLVTGALNVIRRLDDASSLLDPGIVFGSSLAASAASGFLVKGAFGLSKVSALAQTKVDNLVGAQQTINLFKVQQRDPASSAVATYGDVGRFLAGTAWETGALASHRFNPANATPSQVLGQLADVVNYAVMNSIASVGSVGIGVVVASGVRGQSQMGPAVGEAHNSTGYLVQQFMQSASNDYLWNGAKKLTGSLVSNLGNSLDALRAIASADAEQAHLIAPELTI